MLSRSSASTVKHQPATHSKVVDWREESACRQFYKNLKKGEADIFFPPQGKAEVIFEAALQYCRTCPVREACLEYALDKGETRDGIFGGTTPSERKQLLKQRRQTADPESKTRKKKS